MASRPHSEPTLEQRISRGIYRTWSHVDFSNGFVDRQDAVDALRELVEQLETLRGDYDEQVRLVMRLGEQLEVLQRVADAARYQVQHYAGDTTVTLISAIDHLNASYPQYEDHPSRVGEAP